MHTVWFRRVDCGSMWWSKGDDFVKSSHLAPLRFYLLLLWVSGVQEKPQNHTVHHLKSEWATVRG